MIRAQEPAGLSRTAPDTLKVRLSVLLDRYQQHLIRDTDYLKAVDSIAPLLEKEDSLPGLLSTYRQLAFGDAGDEDGEKRGWGLWGGRQGPGRGKYRAGYYTYLAINAYNFSRLGGAIYYSEKNSSERMATGQFEKGGFSHSDWFALTVYGNNHNYPRVFAKYAKLRPALVALPKSLDTGKISPEQVFVAAGMLQTVNYAACRSGDTSRAREVMGLMKDIMRHVDRKAADSGEAARFRSYRLLYAYLTHNMYYEYYRLSGQWEPARDSLLAAIRDVLTKGFPPHLQASYAENLYSEAVDLYFNQNKPDSARYYLSLLNAGDGKVRYSSLDQRFLPESYSRLLAGQGRYAEAYAQLHTVYKMLDSAYYTVSADKDNNLYALAEAENTRLDLLRLEEKKRAAERSSITLFFVLTILVLTGVTVFMVFRARQERRLLDLRLQLARNFHDEIGPMLLYASILAKKQGETGGAMGYDGIGPDGRVRDEGRALSAGGELRGQIGKIMRAVRDISHDLKSTRLGTIGSFGKEIGELLEKVRSAADIDFLLQLGNGTKVLSHGQVTNLLAIVKELISNSIKHADCGKITVKVNAPDKQIVVYYSDDGKGFDPGGGGEVSGDAGAIGGAEGIGMQNIRERVELLRGKVQLNNSWPEGYFIDISIPLV